MPLTDRRWRKAATISCDDSRPFSCYTEARIIELAKAGDSSAFAELVHRNYARAQRLAYLVARNHAVAEDAVGTGFYQAFTHLFQLESTGSFSAWLNRIIINECHQTVRMVRRTTLVEFEERLHSPEWTPQARHTWTPEDQACDSELLRVIAAEIRRIPPHLREPLLLRIQDHTVPQIAARLGLTESAVKARVHRARSQLRTRFARHLSSRYNFLRPC